jgi:ribosome-binding protein aMBF1 (putative translation factor)
MVRDVELVLWRSGTCSERFGGCPPLPSSVVPRPPKVDDPTAQAFGSALKQAREARDETLEAVAGRVVRVGRGGKPTVLDSKYLQALESGRHSPTITTAKQLADALDVSLADLVRDL